MSFGDWELFRMFIVSLREQELSSVTNIEETSPKNVRFTVPKAKPGPPQAERKSMLLKLTIIKHLLYNSGLVFFLDLAESNKDSICNS